MTPSNDDQDALCPSCSSITIEGLFNHTHQPTFSSLQRSALACPLCNLIYHAIEPRKDTPEPGLGGKTPAEADFQILLEGISTRAVESYEHPRKQWCWQNVQIGMLIDPPKPERVTLGYLSPFVEERETRSAPE